jgi:hypothetical protein
MQIEISSPFPQYLSEGPAYPVVLYENHETSLMPFIGQHPTFDGLWTEESTATEMPAVLALSKKVHQA